MSTSTTVRIIALSAALVWTGHAAVAAETPHYEITLKDHQFSPAELELPANTRVKITVKNLDATPAEFESKDFKVEKVIGGGKQVSFFVGPLKPGSYGYEDEYHEDTTKGRLIVGSPAGNR